MMGQGDKKIRIRRTNEQLDKEVISEFEKLVGEFGFGNVNLSALMKAADLEANVFYRRYGSMDNLYDRLAKQYDFWINNTIDISTLSEREAILVYELVDYFTSQKKDVVD